MKKIAFDAAITADTLQYGLVFLPEWVGLYLKNMMKVTKNTFKYYII